MNSGKFCPYCGAPYENPANTVPPAYQQQNQGFYEQPAQQYQQPYGYNKASYDAPKKSSKAPVIALVIAIIFIAVFGAFIILEAAGVTEVTGWFDNDSATSVSNDDEENSDEKDSDSNAEDEEEFDETITNDSKKEHEFDKYSETRESDGDGDSEFSYSEDTYSSSDAEKVADYVEANKAAYAASSTNSTGTGFLEADGTSIICGFKYSVDVQPGTNTALSTLLDSDDMTNAFETILVEAQKEEPAITSLIVEYYDKNGVLLCSKEYK